MKRRPAADIYRIPIDGYFLQTYVWNKPVFDKENGDKTEKIAEKPKISLANRIGLYYNDVVFFIKVGICRPAIAV